MNNKKNILIFILGAITGALASTLYYDKKFNDFIQAEADGCENTTYAAKEELAKRKYPLKEDDVDTEDSEEYDDVENEPDGYKTLGKVAKNHKVLKMNRVHYNEIARNYGDSSIENRPPHVISFEEFCEGTTHHDKITITYYNGDNTLTDENEDIVVNVEELIGDALNRFGQDSEDPNVVYVRNDKMAIDYEIVMVETNYSEVVGGSKET